MIQLKILKSEIIRKLPLSQNAFIKQYITMCFLTFKPRLVIFDIVKIEISSLVIPTSSILACNISSLQINMIAIR